MFLTKMISQSLVGDEVSTKSARLPSLGHIFGWSTFFAVGKRQVGARDQFVVWHIWEVRFRGNLSLVQRHVGRLNLPLLT